MRFVDAAMREYGLDDVETLPEVGEDLVDVDEEDTAKVCYINYGVTFNMFEPVSVRGKNADPIFKHLAAQSASPKWNFYKYLVSADGARVEHFTSTTKPSSDKFQQALQSMLK